MNLSDVHPDEIVLQNYIKELKQFIARCEGQFLDEHTKENLRHIRMKVFELHGIRASAYLNKKDIGKELPEDEQETLDQLVDIIEKITGLLGEGIEDFLKVLGKNEYSLGISTMFNKPS